MFEGERVENPDRCSARVCVAPQNIWADFCEIWVCDTRPASHSETLHYFSSVKFRAQREVRVGCKHQMVTNVSHLRKISHQDLIVPIIDKIIMIIPLGHAVA
jgi:hypothetical protein